MAGCGLKHPLLAMPRCMTLPHNPPQSTDINSTACGLASPLSPGDLAPSPPSPFVDAQGPLPHQEDVFEGYEGEVDEQDAAAAAARHPKFSRRHVVSMVRVVDVLKRLYVFF